MRSAERSEAKTPRLETEVSRKQSNLLPAFFMSLPLYSVKGIVAVSDAGEIGCFYEVGGVTDEVILHWIWWNRSFLICRIRPQANLF